MNLTPARLAVIALVTGLLLSATNAITKSRVDANREAFAARQLLEIVALNDVSVGQVSPTRYVLRAGPELVGFIFEVTTGAGYNGRINLWLGVNLSGKVIGTRVKYHAETPGLGDKIDLAVSDWILEFNGYQLGSNKGAWNVRRDGGDFDQFSGATITPRAVVHAVRDGLETFELQKANWVAEAMRDEP